MDADSIKKKVQSPTLARVIPDLSVVFTSFQCALTLSAGSVHASATEISQYFKWFPSSCVLCLVGEMVQRKLLPQLELSLLPASGVWRCVGEDHSLGCGQWHRPL